MFIVSRKKELIIRGGYNVYPSEIENALHADPAIAEAAVVGIPMSGSARKSWRWSSLRPAMDLLEHETLAYCRERLPAYKCPRVFQFRVEPPKNSLRQGPEGRADPSLTSALLEKTEITEGRKGAPQIEIPRLARRLHRRRRRVAWSPGRSGGRTPEHLTSYSFDPAMLAGNIENFVGVAQVPIGIAGPLLVDGEYARGEFYVPLATTEGSLVASYSRGMKLLHQAGGVTTTVMDDLMQRAPAFGFDTARQARAFGEWVTANFEAISPRRRPPPGPASCVASSSSRPAGTCSCGSTSPPVMRPGRTGRQGDPAGMRLDPGQYPGMRQFFLESNLATDKKSSQVNILRTRGKRVTAEATIPADLVRDVMHPTADQMLQGRQVSNLGGRLAGVNNNGNHSANGIAALFMATGQEPGTWPSRRPPWSTPSRRLTAATTTRSRFRR